MLRSCIIFIIIIIRYDTDNDGYLDVEDLKGMMMVRGVPWTHSAIVRLIKDADEDGDGKLSFREVSVNVSIQYLHTIYTFYTHTFLCLLLNGLVLSQSNF